MKRVDVVLGLVLEIRRRKLGDITVGFAVSERDVRDDMGTKSRGASRQNDSHCDDHDFGPAIAIQVADGGGPAATTVIRL